MGADPVGIVALVLVLFALARVAKLEFELSKLRVTISKLDKTS